MEDNAKPNLNDLIDKAIKFTRVSFSPSQDKVSPEIKLLQNNKRFCRKRFQISPKPYKPMYDQQSHRIGVLHTLPQKRGSNGFLNILKQKKTIQTISNRNSPAATPMISPKNRVKTRHQIKSTSNRNSPISAPKGTILSPKNAKHLKSLSLGYLGLSCSQCTCDKICTCGRRELVEHHSDEDSLSSVLKNIDSLHIENKVLKRRTSDIFGKIKKEYEKCKRLIPEKETLTTQLSRLKQFTDLYN
ncbi:unnamed protein product [Blepharisma stoltei]|uniref:Uncharacterized protein n=1 Tax=Blepharisma stoltei TaxID=1481888 RepID=A0AAU9JYF2_9CILI|nr:unnamed protein product [Blepharisma stoltei]